MKLLHLADLHAGLVTHSRPDPSTGLPSRLLDVAQAFGQAVDLAIEERVDLVVLAGDSFHEASPSAAALALFAAELERLRAERIPLFLIAGNHDRGAHPGAPSVVEIFDQRPVIRAASVRPEIVELAGIRIASLPSVSRHQLMAAGGRSAASADEMLRDGLRSIVDGFRSRGADLLVGHWPISGALLGGEVDIAIIPEPMLAPEDLHGPWPYVALGHLHRRQVRLGLRDGRLDWNREATNGAFRAGGAFAGSICQMNFGEEGEPKGAWLVDLRSPEEAVIEWREIPGRRFVSLGPNWRESTWGEEAEGSIIRVQVEAGLPVAEEEQIRNALLGLGAFSVKIQRAATPRSSARMPEIREQAGPLEALERWLSREEPDAERRRRVLASAAEMLEADRG